MESEISFIAGIVATIFASSGFWTFITARFQEKHKKESAESKMLKGLGHDRICYLGACYIKQGFITKDDYENLHDYLYVPYKELGGNGTAEKVMKDVDKLPLVKE